MPRKLIIATRNRHKTGEISVMLGPEWTVEDLSARPDLPEPEETGATFEKNAAIKAIAASQALNALVLADDSGLSVDALDGAPGVISARYAGPKATDKQNRDKLLAELTKQEHAADKPMSARFHCAMTIAESGKVLAAFTGLVEGRIVLAESGTGGFGYDPLFIPEGYNQTFAELNPETKNKLSHRARALEQVLTWLTSH